MGLLQSIYIRYDHPETGTAGSSVIDRPSQALEKLYKAGYSEILVQPTHILAGIEYHNLKTQTEIFARRHVDISVRLGQPILYENDDYQRAAKALAAYMPHTGEHEVVLLMGHGSEHFSNASYFALQHYLDELPTRAVYVANVEAPPLLEEAITQMKKEGIQKVYLMPFMLVAGDHAKMIWPAMTDILGRIVLKKRFSDGDYFKGTWRK